MQVWKEVSSERFDEMLGVLPPAVHTGFGFLVGEPWDHNAEGYPRFAPFLSVSGRYYEGSEPITAHEFRALDARQAVQS